MTIHSIHESLVKAGSDQPKHDHYDVVIVGARAAGAATAMLLARRGVRVLAVDRQPYGSDTLSTHALMRGTVARLAKWGLLESIWDSGTPVINTTAFQYGTEAFSVRLKAEPGIDGLAAPRRTVLDPILVDEARVAGAEILHRTSVRGLRSAGDGRVNGVDLTLVDGTERSISTDLVVGADGMRSFVARAVAAPMTHRGEHGSASTVQYYENLDVDRGAFRWLFRENGGGGVIPTTDDQVCVFTGIPADRFRSHGRQDVGATHTENLQLLDPELASAVGRATPIGPLRSFPGVPGFFRKAYGPGWALVGDAGYFKDPYAAHGVTDAFRDAERLTDAVLTGDFPGYETGRDAISMPLFTVLDRIASYHWNLEELQLLHRQLSIAMKEEEENNPVGQFELAA